MASALSTVVSGIGISVEYPEITERVEEKLKKQVEDKEFDFEAIKKIVGASIARLSVSKKL